MGKRYSKFYHRMMKEYKKEFKKISKKATPWDYGYIEEFVITSLNFMFAYYVNGENVCSLDNPEDPKRIDILNKLRLLWDQYIYCYKRNDDSAEKYYKEFWNYFADYVHYLWD